MKLFTFAHLMRPRHLHAYVDSVISEFSRFRFCHVLLIFQSTQFAAILSVNVREIETR